MEWDYNPYSMEFEVYLNGYTVARFGSIEEVRNYISNYLERSYGKH